MYTKFRPIFAPNIHPVVTINLCSPHFRTVRVALREFYCVFLRFVRSVLKPRSSPTSTPRSSRTSMTTTYAKFCRWTTEIACRNTADLPLLMEARRTRPTRPALCVGVLNTSASPHLLTLMNINTWRAHSSHSQERLRRIPL